MIYREQLYKGKDMEIFYDYSKEFNSYTPNQKRRIIIWLSLIGTALVVIMIIGVVEHFQKETENRKARLASMKIQAENDARIAEYRSASTALDMKAPILGSGSNGYAWARASYDDQMKICEAYERSITKPGINAQWIYGALDAAYDTRQDYILRQTISEVIKGCIMISGM